MDNSNSEPPWEQSFGFIPDISGRLFDMTGDVFPSCTGSAGGSGGRELRVCLQEHI